MYMGSAVQFVKSPLPAATQCQGAIFQHASLLTAVLPHNLSLGRDTPLPCKHWWRQWTEALHAPLMPPPHYITCLAGYICAERLHPTQADIHHKLSIGRELEMLPYFDTNPPRSAGRDG